MLPQARETFLSHTVRQSLYTIIALGYVSELTQGHVTSGKGGHSESYSSAKLSYVQPPPLLNWKLFCHSLSSEGEPAVMYYISFFYLKPNISNINRWECYFDLESNQVVKSLCWHLRDGETPSKCLHRTMSYTAILLFNWTYTLC